MRFFYLVMKPCTYNRKKYLSLSIMSKISIVIVNYKVKHFLKQCLYAIGKATIDMDVDVWVVDNDSRDGSEEMIKQFFPKVNLIVNKENIGFSKANNIALRQIKTPYTLILNPDTVLSEDTLSSCLAEMEGDDSIGMIGVRMVDGAGTYLPESKRGFPTPSSSFYKLSGFYKFFPRSAYFNHYYLGHLSEFDRNEVEVLTGAFMFSRTDVLSKVNYFDEDYFMYGEDIDLSTKVIKEGYKLIYLPDTSIIHFKGESTKRDSAAYVKHFYNAMLIFTKKHFSGSEASIFAGFLKLGVFIRGALGFINKVVLKRAAILIDFIIAFLSLELVTKLWAKYYYYDPSYFDGTSIHYNNLVYSLFWCLALYIVGHYGRRFTFRKVLVGILFGSSLIFILYALLGSQYNPSRVIIILGMLLFGFVLTLKRGLSNFFDTGKVFLNRKKTNKVLLVARESEVELIKSKLNNSSEPKSYIGFIQINKEESVHSLGTIDQIFDIVATYEIDEIVFSLTHYKLSDIMPIMTQLGNKVKIKLTGGEHLNIIGSNSKNLSGEVYMMDIQYNIDTIENRRQKRVFDILASLLSIILYPFFKLRNSKIHFKDLIMVLIGRKTYIGYNPLDKLLDELPPVKVSIVPSDFSKDLVISDANKIHNYNLRYAKNYKIGIDINLFFKYFGW